MRGETIVVDDVLQLGDISIHSPHAGRDCQPFGCPCPVRISIHSPHAGRDDKLQTVINRLMAFQSTLPMRGETGEQSWQSGLNGISIHSPHAGRDAVASPTARNVGNFNPLSPCGERPGQSSYVLPNTAFQSTLPMRGETSRHNHPACHGIISIHSPHAGRDLIFDKPSNWTLISIHSPHAGRDFASV